jgi:hypothetical protein
MPLLGDELWVPQSGLETIVVLTSKIADARLFLLQFCVSSLINRCKVSSDQRDRSLCIARRGFAVKRTPWIDACCRYLTEAEHHPLDASIERFIKARSLFQNIADCLLGETHCDFPSEPVIEMSQKAFRNELKTLQCSFAPLTGIEYRKFSPMDGIRYVMAHIGT